MQAPKRIYYFASTHWDREWYKTVDEFRFKLARVMEDVLDTLESDENFKLFTLDGQTRILADYLVIGKQNKNRILKLLKENRLRIGPWYTMPDEFLLSHESIVRNLEKGHLSAAEYSAKPLKHGYICDTFGHIANLPQILRGFNIDSALISRGTNDCETPCFFDWQSPDGSTVFTFKAPETCGYGSFHYEVLSEFLPDYENNKEEIFRRAVAYVKRETERTALPYVILMDGMDHETIHPCMPELLKRLQQYFNCPVVQLPLDEAFSAIRSDSENVPLLHGELARLCKDNVMHNKLIPHTLSSRYDLKRANDDCQTLLEKCALPICASLAMSGKRTDSEFLDYAYDVLLLNHAHDSICGCSIDAVHREMTVRFDKAKHTASGYITQFLADEYARCEVQDGKTTVKIYNPLPYAYEGALTFDICFDPQFPIRELPYVKFEQRNGFRIFDADGNEIPYNIVRGARRKKEHRFFGKNYAFCDTHTVTLWGKLPPASFTTYEIRPYDRPYRVCKRFSTSPTSCDNGLIALSVNADGTVRIEDKETGNVYDGLHSFTDCGEIGDGWFHIRPIADTTVSSLGCHVSISKTFDGYAACKFLVTYEMRVPECARKKLDFYERTGEMTLRIESEFTVERASKLVKVHTVVHNTAFDHKLCLRLPVKNPDTYFVNQCNLILERKTGIDVAEYDWKEADIPERQFESMIFTREQNRGLLFISKGGLHEVANLGGDFPALTITLLRAFGLTVGTNGEPDGQLHGDVAFDYALMPFADKSDADLVKIKDGYVCEFPCFTVKTDRIEAEIPQMEFVSAHCAFVTCMQKNNGILVRAANYSATDASGELSFAHTPRTAYLCDYLGNRTQDATVIGNTVHFVAKPYQSVNIQVLF